MRPEIAKLREETQEVMASADAALKSARETIAWLRSVNGELLAACEWATQWFDGDHGRMLNAAIARAKRGAA